MPEAPCAVKVRPLRVEDTAEATRVWAEAMLSYDKVYIKQFVAEKLQSDMKDAHASYVEQSGTASGFWVATVDDAIVGCVGAIMRTKEDLSGGLPPGKEYLSRIKDKDGVLIGEGVDDGPLWGPLGVDGTAPAAELVRMAVLPGHRGKGVARTLVRRVAEFALEAGCEWVVLTTAREMLAAVATYEHLGFQCAPRPMVMAFAQRPRDLLATGS